MILLAFHHLSSAEVFHIYVILNIKQFIWDGALALACQCFDVPQT